MPREEYIRIFRSNVPGSNPPSLTSGEIAANLGDGRLFIGGTNGSLITFFPGGITSFNGLTGIVTFTGDGGAIRGVDNTYVTARFAGTSTTGVASFSNANFAISLTGQVSIKTGSITPSQLENPSFFIRDESGNAGTLSLGTNYQITGGNGIDTTTQGGGLLIANTGVLTVNGLNGSVTLTGDLGAVVADPAVGRFTARQASTTGQTGVASFSPADFTVSATGQVKLIGNGFTIRDEMMTTDVINLGDTLTITGGTGIDVIRTSTDTLRVTALVASNSVTGIASYNPDHFLIGASGHVRSRGVITVNNNAPDSSGNVTVSVGQTVTGDASAIRGVDNSYITARLATTGVTGVASFNSQDFFIAGNTGHVSLTANVARTNLTQTFTNKQYFNGGLSAAGDFGFWLSSGATNAEVSLRPYGFASLEETPPPIKFVLKTSESNGAVFCSPYATIDLTPTSIFLGQANPLLYGAPSEILYSTVSVGLPSEETLSSVPNGPWGSKLVLNSAVNNLGSYAELIFAGDGAGSTSSIAIPTGVKGVLALTNTVVSRFNGLTGNVTLTGDGGAIRGNNNSSVVARLASVSVTGVASFNSKNFVVDNNGRVSLSGSYDSPVILNGLTGGISLTTGNISSPVISPPINITPVGKDILFSLREASGVNGYPGIASFSALDFGVEQGGHVSLTGNVARTTTTVASLNGLTGARTITGDGAAIIGGNNNTITARQASTTGQTGVASFSPADFTVSATGQVKLIGNGFTIRDEAGTSRTVLLGDIVQITGAAGIDVTDQAGGLRISNTGLLTLNGLSGSINLTGDGRAIIGDPGGGRFTARVVSDNSVTGVASFNATHFTVGSTGHVTLAAAYATPSFSIRDEKGTVDTISLGDTFTITGGTGIDVIRTSTDTLRITSNITGDAGAIGISENAIKARLGTPCGTTGVVGVKCGNAIQVDGNGLIYLASGDPCTECQANSTQGACQDAGCYWCGCNNACYCNAEATLCSFCFETELGIAKGFFNYPYSGYGVSANNGAVSYIYLDANNLTGYAGNFTSKTDNFVLIFDSDEAGLVKTKKTSLKNFFLNNLDTLLESKSTNQFTRTKGGDSIEFATVLGAIQAGEEGLIKGASAFDYIESNTVKAINGCTGGTFEITGTVQEVTVTTGINCRQIVIGLPDSVRIPHISGTGGTFSGTITANKFVGSMDGGLF